ncbi:cytochrome P450 [Suillus americanus]|nr:cytochrome P450 [Suillus americanus]
MLTLTNITGLDLYLTCVGVYLKQVFKTNPAPYPPGPPRLPLFGNALSDMPHNKPWLTFTEWGKKYDSRSTIVVLNSAKTAMELLDNKSNVYSDRPVLPMGGELVGWQDSLSLIPYGDRFRQYRKNIHRVIGSRAAVDTYSQVVEDETPRFLKSVMTKPDQLQEHIRHTAGAIILRISHGYKVKENNDPFIDLANRVMAQASQATAPGAFMVDIMPFLAKVPVWFSGAGFKRIAREWRETLEEMVSAPHKFVKDQMVSTAGIAPKSFTSNLLGTDSLTVEEEHVVKWSALSLYAGGADMVNPSLHISDHLLTMTLFPDVQKKAQAEIDVVVGPNRLPSFADRDSLPYTEALAKEVLRWHAVLPTGMRFPSIALFMLNDPRTYAKPSQFEPDRFLAKDGKESEIDPRTTCFGFGRRICPGLHLADASIWISTAMSLAVFDISKVIENGYRYKHKIIRTHRTTL